MKGLTLLEVLISIAILGIIMGAIYGTYTSNVEAIQVARQKGHVYQMTRILFDRMTKDLESALINVSSPHEKIRLGMIGKNQEIDGKPADRIDFTTLNHLTLGGEGPGMDLCEVGYQVVEDSENEGFKLFRRDDGILDDDLIDGGFSHEMASRVTGLDIIFQDVHGKEFDDWNTLEGEHAGKLPSLITIRLTIVDEEAQEYLFTTSIHPALADRKKGE
jgi:prepilin-type N-terminal cleavage/methylation domain-containing protein